MLKQLFSTPKRLLEQQREISQLKQLVLELEQKNTSMQQGMRRCVTCDYRLEVKQRQDQAIDVGNIESKAGE